MTRSPKHILVIEREHEVLYGLNAALRYEGYRVTAVASGMEGLRVIESEDIPALVLLDLSVEDIDAFVMLMRIAEIAPIRQPTVIAMVVKGDRKRAVRAVQMGAADFLEKPVGNADLVMSVQMAMSGPQPARAVKPRSMGELLRVIRRDIKRHHLAHAERVMEEAAETVGQEAAYFNLLGVLAEADRKPSVARAFYRKAAAFSGPSVEAAKRNIQRLDEIQDKGDTLLDPQFGEEDSSEPGLYRKFMNAVNSGDSTNPE